MSERFMSEIVDEWQREMEAKQRAYEERLANDPEFARSVREREEKAAAEEARKQAEADRLASIFERARLSELGIPAKDVDALYAGSLRDTAALSIARGWWEDDSSAILVLSGTRGCGKTTAAAWCVAQEPRENPFRDYDMGRYSGHGHREPRANRPRSRLFLDVTKLQRASRYDDEQMASIEYAATLAIDDLGMEYADAKGSFAALFDGLFNTRYAERLKTVITTNLTAQDFKARYGERVADRIREAGRFVELNEQSLRGAK